MRSFVALPLIASCLGCGGEATGGPADGALPGGTATMAASLRFASGQTIDYAAVPAFTLQGGVCSCTGAEAGGMQISIAWSASRADATGPATLAELGVYAIQVTPSAKYHATQGSAEVTSLSPGHLAGTFTATMVTLTSYPTGSPPPAEEQLAQISSGTFVCEGQSEGPYATCFQ